MKILCSQRWRRLQFGGPWNGSNHQWTCEEACQLWIVDISKISSGHEGYQMPFGLVEET